MKFIFPDKNPIETDIITDILTDEHISYRVSTSQITTIYYGYGVTVQTFKYNIEVNTIIEKFEFIKFLAKKAMKKRKKRFKQIQELEKCYTKKYKKGKINMEVEK